MRGLTAAGWPPGSGTQLGPCCEGHRFGSGKLSSPRVLQKTLVFWIFKTEELQARAGGPTLFLGEKDVKGPGDPQGGSGLTPQCGGQFAVSQWFRTRGR